MNNSLYTVFVPIDIEVFLHTLENPNKFLLSLIENSKEYKNFVSSQNNYKNEPSLFD
ncbi:MAG: hypothetical protein SPE37_00475 [Campylobacter sp.]|nr:hypothetical protein [Campylobacter sp.]